MCVERSSSSVWVFGPLLLAGVVACGGSGEASDDLDLGESTTALVSTAYNSDLEPIEVDFAFEAQLEPDGAETAADESLKDALRRFPWVSGPCKFRGTACTCTQTPSTCTSAGGSEEFCYSCCGKSCSTPGSGAPDPGDDLTEPVLTAH